MLSNDKKFSIKETVNKNIEKVQFPSFNNHRTLIGWCGMNYPKVLMNPQYMAKPKQKEYSDDLDLLYQMRSKDRQNQQLVKPFTNYIETNQTVQQEKIGCPPIGFKKSLLTLTTTKPETKAQILQESLKGKEQYLNIRPLSCELGQTNNKDFSRKIRQIGEVYYNPSYENEEIRHLKKLPNSIITEQNLIEILKPELKYLNMHNHTWISKEQVNKIGYFAHNIEELILSQTDLEDEILVELAKSCKQLKRIDISQCNKLTENGIRKFLEVKADMIESLKCAHNNQSVSDYSLEPLKYAPNLKNLNVSFCSNLSQNSLICILDSGSKIIEFQASTLSQLSPEVLSQFLINSQNTLELIDLSFIPTKEIGEIVLIALGQCNNLQQIILTGCSQISDHQINKMSSGQGFKKLKTLKLGGLVNLSDNSLNSILQQSPELKFLEINNLERLSENSLNNMIKNCPNLEIVNMNFTPNISDEFLKEKQMQNPNIRFIRNINKMTDQKDDGLRMPLPLKSVVMQRPKKDKKKKK